MTPGEFVELMVNRHTKEDYVNVLGIARDIGISIYQKDMASLTELAELNTNKDGNVVILLNKNNDTRHNYTLVALLIAQLMLHPEKAETGGIKYDVFSLKDIRDNRFSNIMMLATRLAVPEFVIDQMEDFSFDVQGYANKSKFLPDFIKSAVKSKNLEFLVSNDMTGVANYNK